MQQTYIEIRFHFYEMELTSFSLVLCSSYKRAILKTAKTYAIIHAFHRCITHMKRGLYA